MKKVIIFISVFLLAFLLGFCLHYYFYKVGLYSYTPIVNNTTSYSNTEGEREVAGCSLSIDKVIDGNLTGKVNDGELTINYDGAPVLVSPEGEFSIDVN